MQPTILKESSKQFEQFLYYTSKLSHYERANLLRCSLSSFHILKTRWFYCFINNQPFMVSPINFYRILSANVKLITNSNKKL